VDADGMPARTKLWDACLYNGFARTAGGGNPRPLRDCAIDLTRNSAFSRRYWGATPAMDAGAAPKPASRISISGTY